MVWTFKISTGDGIMEIKRIKDPKIIKYLRPYFTEDGAFTRDIIAKELFEIMIAVPDEIFVAVIFEKDEIYGFGIAWIQDNREYVWLAQAYSKPGCKRDYGKQAIEMIKQWAIDEHCIHKVRFETERNPKVIERVWGFKTHAYIMEGKF